MTKVIVRVGVVDVPTDFAGLAEQRRLAQINPAAARSFACMRRFFVGETLLLSAGDAARLAALGILELVP